MTARVNRTKPLFTTDDQEESRLITGDCLVPELPFSRGSFGVRRKAIGRTRDESDVKSRKGPKSTNMLPLEGRKCVGKGNRSSRFWRHSNNGQINLRKQKGDDRG